MIFFIHNKTGKRYVMQETVIDCTNGADEREMILYMNQAGERFVREKNEFYEKFTQEGL